ncbi:MAG: cupin domain-containing protein [Gemmatimonadaceae bacterium]
MGAKDPDDSTGSGISRSDAEALALIASAVAQQAAPPPATLRTRIMAQARERTLSYVASHAGIWLPVSAGVDAKALYLDSADRATTRLLRLAPSTPLPDRPLVGSRGVYVLGGALGEGQDVLTEGDFVEERAESGWRATDQGALVLEFGSTVTGSDGVVRRVNDAKWIVPFPGARLRPLRGAHGAPDEAFVLDMAPRSSLADHDHSGLEELFVLRGSCLVEGQTMTEGDYHRAAAGTHHHTTTTETGCQLIVVVRDLSRLAA